MATVKGEVIMDYEKKYKEMKARVLEIGRGYVKDLDYSNPRQIAEYIDPELKESEDERIINRIKKAVENYWSDEPLNEILAWLKEQGEHANFLSKIQVGDKVTRNEDGVPVNLSQLNRVAKKPADKVEPKFKVGDTMRTLQEAKDGWTDGMPVVVSIDEGYYYCNNELIAIKDQDDYEYPPMNRRQKHADKTEPKFHEGEWIVHHGTENIYQVVAVIDTQYQLKYGDNYTIQKCADVDRCARLWDITKDAKRGDVLSDGTTIFIFKDLLSDGSVMSYCDYDTDSGENDAFCPLSMNLMCSKITPATKEQRDLLFQKMHEAGYKWDAEKKELKNVEQKPADKVEPKFKVGDKIYLKPEYRMADDDTPIANTVKEIIRIDDKHYRFDGSYIFIEDQDKYELVEQKTAWSEEDENIKESIITGLEMLKDVVSDQSLIALYNKKIDWLKDLKERYTWKPSDEQIIELRHVISGCSYDIEPLVELETKLKEL